MNGAALEREVRFGDAVRVVDFISDIHLSEAMPATARAWEDYLAATRADAVFMLGDLFEVWVGDDARSRPFEARCVEAIAALARRVPVFVQHGNRDFLLGTGFAEATGARLLADPCALTAFGRTILATHGDELCVDDVPYQLFRQQVRNPAYQAQFLAQPLEARLAIAAKMRAASRASHDEPVTYADVDPALAKEWLGRAGTDTMIHGHTHRPGTQALDGWTRHVLSDWDLDAPDPARHRAEVLRWTAAGLERLPPSQA
ncbi:MAG: UDP-2,3-diacylglucosamine diphosphatase [Burkholderiaceae bacterium]